MGIPDKTFEKLKNLEPFTVEEKKEILKDLVGKGFPPIIYQVRATFDLIDSLEKLNKSTRVSGWIMGILTFFLVVFTAILIW